MFIQKKIIAICLIFSLNSIADKQPCILWQKQFGYPNSNDICYDAILTSHNTIVLTGVARGQSPYTDDGCFIMAIDTLGTILWQKDIDKSAVGLSITETQNSELIVLTRYGTEGGHLVKTDANGELLWLKKIGPFFAGSNYNVPYQHCITSTGEIAVTGISNFNEDDHCMYLYKLNRNADTHSRKLFSFKPDFYFQEGQVVIPGENGSVLIGGNGVYNSKTYFNAMVLKVDSAYSEVWFHEYGENLYETVSSMAHYRNGDLAIAIDRYTDLWNEKHLWLLRTTATGDTIWSKTYSFGGTVEACKIFPTENNGLLITGSSRMERWTRAVSVGEIDSIGNLIWEYRSPKFGQLTIEAAVHLGNREFIIIGDTRSAGTSDADICLYRVGFRETPVFIRIPDSINVKIGIEYRDTIAACDAEKRTTGIRYWLPNPIYGVSIDSLSGEFKILASPYLIGTTAFQVSVIDTCGLRSDTTIKFHIEPPEDCPIKYYPFTNSTADINDTLKWFHSTSWNDSTSCEVLLASDSTFSNPLIKVKKVASTFIPISEISRTIVLQNQTAYYWQVEEFNQSERKFCSQIMKFIFVDDKFSKNNIRYNTATHPLRIRRIYGDLYEIIIPKQMQKAGKIDMTLYDLKGRIIGKKVLNTINNFSTTFSMKSIPGNNNIPANQIMLCTIKGDIGSSNVIITQSD